MYYCEKGSLTQFADKN